MPAWNSVAARRYTVRAAPTVSLLDQRGRTAWIGPPAETDVEKEIDALLDGKN